MTNCLEHRFIDCLNLSFLTPLKVFLFDSSYLLLMQTKLVPLGGLQWWREMIGNVQSPFCLNILIPLFVVSYFNFAPFFHFPNSSPAQQCLPQSFRLCESFFTTHKEFSFVCADLHCEHLCCLPGCWRRRSRCQSCRASWPRWETPWSFTGERTM